jgi:hypothetical protein
MKALSENELRIGNLVHSKPYDYLVYKIKSIEHSIRFRVEGDYYLWVESISKSERTVIPIQTKGNYNIEQFAPIPLTQEWMQKNGEKDENGDPFIYHSKEYDMRYYLNDKGFIQLTKGQTCPLLNYEHIIYVHLFQGLYFYETGKELELSGETR